MGNKPSEPGEELTLKGDDRGRITLPKRIREQLDIEPNEEISASLVGSVLELSPRPSAKLEPATAGRGEWEASTPMDAGEGLFGPLSDQDQ